MRSEIRKVITRFWKGKLSKLEQEELLRELQDNEVGQDAFKANLQQEFDATKIPTKGLATDKVYKDLLQDLHSKIVVNTNRTRVFTFTRLLRVACILIAVGFSLSLFLYHQPAVNNVKEKLASVDSIFLQNDSSVEKLCTLKDGSTIILYPNSRITYTAEYGLKERALSLKGKARFTVAHDRLHPFIVSASGYSTTALGTMFTVDTQKRTHLSVKLHEGKVVVKSSNPHVLPMTDQYLLAGDEWQLDLLTGIYAVIKKQNSSITPKSSSTALVSAHQEKQELIVFDKTPLAEVFKRFEVLKMTPIQFDETKLKQMDFTGTFDTHEDLLVMLNIVCQMNNLNYRKEGQHIIIE